MNPSFDHLQGILKKLPGLGYRSAERVALHLLVEKPERAEALIQALEDAGQKLKRCPITGNITEGERCPIYEDPTRERGLICVVEQVPDLMAFEKSGAFRGTYHVLFGKLSPIHDVGPEDLNLQTLDNRLASDGVGEIILALSNDIEGEATCHYIQDELIKKKGRSIKTSRIGFGLPSGSGVTYADSTTLKSALEGRRDYE